jgi:hypothetical protein
MEWTTARPSQRPLELARRAHDDDWVLTGRRGHLDVTPTAGLPGHHVVERDLGRREGGGALVLGRQDQEVADQGLRPGLLIEHRPGHLGPVGLVALAPTFSAEGASLKPRRWWRRCRLLVAATRRRRDEELARSTT